MWIATTQVMISSDRKEGMVARVKKAALFVRCTEEEAEKIRRTAKAERRTVSGFVLNAVFNRIAMRERLLSEHEESKAKGPARTP